jgi:hypothetical protein
LITIRCQNCGDSKPPSSELCSACQDLLVNVEKQIETEKIEDMFKKDALRQNILFTRRKALGIAARPDPRQLFNTLDSRDFDARIAVSPGSPGDPRRSGGI